MCCELFVVCLLCFWFVCCSLFVVRCPSFVDCCVPVGNGVLIVVRWLLLIVCCSSYVVCGPVFVARCCLFVCLFVVVVL